MVLFCALGMRSALATKSLIDMGFKNVAHVNGGFRCVKAKWFRNNCKRKKIIILEIQLKQIQVYLDPKITLLLT